MEDIDERADLVLCLTVNALIIKQQKLDKNFRAIYCIDKSVIVSHSMRLCVRSILEKVLVGMSETVVPENKKHSKIGAIVQGNKGGQAIRDKDP